MKKVLGPAALLLFASCSVFRPRIAPYPAGVSFPLVEAARVTYEGNIIRSPRAAEGKIYLATDKGFLYCLDGAKKTILWEFAASLPFACPPLVESGRTYICDRANVLYSFDGDGRMLWSKENKETIAGEMVWHKGRIYLGTREGDLLACDPATQEITRPFKAGGALEAGPVFWDRGIVLACADGKVYFLGPDGKLRMAVDVGSPVRVTPLVDGGRLFFGSDDSHFHCYGLSDLKRKWRIRIGGRVMVAPRAAGGRIFFLASNNVLYALARSGNIQWWRIIPARASFDLEFSPGQIIVTSPSAVLICLDRKTGEDIGRYDAGAEIRSGALWLDPDLLVNLYDFEEDKGSLIFLEKEVKAGLSASLESPQPAGTEIAFTATAVGFYLPRFEFFLRGNEEGRTIVQEESGLNSWVWFPEKEGHYLVGVRVSDERQSREAEIPFEVAKKFP
jgi:outer membrane protein assembly factor BamB